MTKKLSPEYWWFEKAHPNESGFREIPVEVLFELYPEISWFGPEGEAISKFLRPLKLIALERKGYGFISNVGQALSRKFPYPSRDSKNNKFSIHMEVRYPGLWKSYSNYFTDSAEGKAYVGNIGHGFPYIASALTMMEIADLDASTLYDCRHVLFTWNYFAEDWNAHSEAQVPILSLSRAHYSESSDVYDAPYIANEARWGT